MPQRDTIIFRIDRETPIELEKLTLGMMSLGAEYHRFIKVKHPKAKSHETDLLVRKVSEGSIVIEMIGAMTPILQGMDNVLIFKDFVETVSSKISILSKKNGRLKDTTPRELSDLTRMVRPYLMIQKAMQS